MFPFTEPTSDDKRSSPGSILRSTLFMAVCVSLLAGIIVSVAAARAAPRAEPVSQPTPKPVAVARGRVEVTGGEHHVTAPAGAVVRRVHVVEGSRVLAGTTLIELERGQQAHERDIALAACARARQELTALIGRLPYEKQKLGRLRQAAVAGGLDAQRLADAAESLRELQAQIEVARSAGAVAQHALALAQWEFDRRVLQARSAGTVTAIQARLGGEAQPGVPLLTLLPDAPLVVRAEVGTHFADRIRTGLRAEVSRDGEERGLPVHSTVAQVGAALSDGVLGEGSVRSATRVLSTILLLPENSGYRTGQLVQVRFYEQNL